MSDMLTDVWARIAQELTVPERQELHREMQRIIKCEVDRAVAREREACAKVAKRAMEDMKVAEHNPHPDDPYEEDKARGGWLTARAIWEDIRARAGEKVEVRR